VASASALYTQAGTYTVTLYTSKGVCTDVDHKVITVDIPSKLNAPNVFTPNGDGINDLYFLNVANMTEITATIFDRWGHKVYELTSGTGNIAWDGTNQVGSKAAAGVYFYVIKGKGKDDKDYDTKGTITLYR
jgi:gliding motility-associated-like protein